MQAIRKSQAVVYFAAGILLALVLVALIGAGGEAPVGRYQMEIVSRTGFTDIFVMDTTTGVIKYVGKDEGKPFSQMQGK